MEPARWPGKWTDRANPLDKLRRRDERGAGLQPGAPPAAQMFGGAGREYRWKYGTERRRSRRSRRRRASTRRRTRTRCSGSRSPSRRSSASPEVFDPLTRSSAARRPAARPRRSCARDDFAKKHGSRAAVRDRGAGDDDRLPVDASRSTHDQDGRLRHGEGRRQKVYEQAGIGPEDVDVVELHDCFTANELLTYEAIGLRPEGEAEKFICDGDNTYGGRVVTNPSGGLLSKGHPLGATGPRPVRRARLAPAWPGRSPPGRGRRRSPCSTTSASAAPASSRCTSARPDLGHRSH